MNTGRQNGRSQPKELLDRAPPSCPDSELMLLRAITLNRELIDSANLIAEHFMVKEHRQIFAALKILQKNRQPIDIAHLDAQLREAGHLDEIGGRPALINMLSGEQIPSSYKFYLSEVQDKHLRRNVLHGSTSTLQDVFSDMPTTDLVEAAQQRMAEVAAEVRHLRRGDQPLVMPMSSIKSQPLEWLWPGRYPLGKFALMIGDPGDGKSLLCIDMAASITRGNLWPCSTERAAQGRVLIISCEDDPGDTIRPRLEAAGADLEKVDLLKAIEYQDTQTGEAHSRMPNRRYCATALSGSKSCGTSFILILALAGALFGGRTIGSAGRWSIRASRHGPWPRT